jgi:hypothetical protein
LKKINFDSLSANENAVHILSRFTPKINWRRICDNKNAMHLLESYTKNFTMNQHKLDWYFLSRNPNALDAFDGNFDRLHMREVCGNPNPKVFDLLDKWLQVKTNNTKYKKQINSISWATLSYREDAISFLEKYSSNYNPHLIFNICSNPGAIPLLMKLTKKLTKNVDKIHWFALSANPHAARCTATNAIPIFEQLVESNSPLCDKIHLGGLANNPNGIKLLDRLTDGFTKNIDTLCSSQSDKLYLDYLCANPNAIHIVEKLTNGLTKKLDERCWCNLCENPNAVSLILEHAKTKPEDIEWVFLSQNESIVEFDKKQYQILLSAYTKLVYNL